LLNPFQFALDCQGVHQEVRSLPVDSVVGKYVWFELLGNMWNDQ